MILPFLFTVYYIDIYCRILVYTVKKTTFIHKNNIHILKVANKKDNNNEKKC